MALSGARLRRQCYALLLFWKTDQGSFQLRLDMFVCVILVGLAGSVQQSNIRAVPTDIKYPTVASMVQVFICVRLGIHVYT